MDIDQAGAADAGHPLWYRAFRCGFLAAGLLAIVAMGRWLWWMEMPREWDYGLAPGWWHAHEMLFGFAMPVVAGFLLTAVAHWTGLSATRGLRLQVLFGLWLASRLLLWFTPGQLWLAWVAEMAFVLLLTWELGGRVWKKRQWRNMWFPPILLGLAALDTLSYLYAAEPVPAMRFFYAMLWMIATLVVIIGGRVIPLFTANRLGITIPPLPAGFEYLCILSVLGIGLAFTFSASPAVPPWLPALCLPAGLIHLYRLHRWRGWKTPGIPLLWSMHLSYLCIPLTLLTLPLAGPDPVALKNIMHLLAIGTVGGMILSMMSRVALGHSGRSLEDLPAYMAWAFAMVLLAATLRAFLPLLDPALSKLAWRVSAGLWILAFGLFLWRYLPILARPRVDGKPG